MLGYAGIEERRQIDAVSDRVATTTASDTVTNRSSGTS